MTQAYRQLAGTDLFADSYGYLNGSDEALRSQFSGAAEPTSLIPFQIWADTTANRLKMRNAANDGWIDLGDLGQAFLNALPRSGGVMTGGIDMGTNAIINLGLGTGTAAARQQELDLKAPIAAPFFTGDARVNQDPNGNDSLTRRSWTEGRYLKLAGGTMTGPIVLTGPGTAPLHPTTYDQMRTFVEFNLTTGHRHDGSDARKVRGTDIDSGASLDATVLRANGSGASAFSALSTVLFASSSPAIVNHTGGQLNYTDIDASSYLPVGAKYAFIKILISDTPAGRSIRARAAGSGSDGELETFGPNVSVGGVSVNFTVLVPVSSGRHFEWKWDGSVGGNNPTVKMYLL